jgi:hypothetical protein
VHYQHQYIPFVFHVHNMQPAKPCCLTGIHTDTKLQLAVVRVTTKYLQCTFQLNPLLKFFNSHYKSVLIIFNGGRKRRKKKHSTMHDEAACNIQSLTASHLDAGEKLHIFICHCQCLCLLPTTNSTHLMRTVDIKKRHCCVP